MSDPTLSSSLQQDIQEQLQQCFNLAPKDQLQEPNPISKRCKGTALKNLLQKCLKSTTQVADKFAPR